jgi:hypothetical protein
MYQCMYSRVALPLHLSPYPTTGIYSFRATPFHPHCSPAHSDELVAVEDADFESYRSPRRGIVRVGSVAPA